MVFLSVLAFGIAQGQVYQPLRETVSRRFRIGTCVVPQLLKNDADGGKYAETIKQNFNLVEPENDLKPPAIWQGIDKYNFANPDFLIGAPGETGWAERNHVAVRGHVLVYARDEGYTIPRWLLQMEAQITPEQAKGILKNYITTVAGRYKGKIQMWDVVNEAIDDRPNTRPFNLRDSFWFRKLGPEFLVLAFKYAHEADPRAELYYNEYSVENSQPKSQSLMALVKYVKDHGGPITGVGLQYHDGLYDHVKPGDAHYALLDKIREERLTFMITELDIGIDVKRVPRSDPTFGTVPTSQEQLQGQADLYRDIFKMATSYPNCHGIQMWGFTDRYSWIPGFQNGHGAALLFDADYRPKPAFSAVEEILRTSHR